MTAHSEGIQDFTCHSPLAYSAVSTSQQAAKEFNKKNENSRQSLSPQQRMVYDKSSATADRPPTRSQ
jgi:hypothetical protein